MQIGIIGLGRMGSRALGAGARPSPARGLRAGFA